MTKFSRQATTLTVASCGSIVMIIEIVGARIMAAYVGTTTFVWAAIIGLVMTALSIGYFIGGKMSVKQTNHRNFAALLVVTAVWLLFVAYLSNPLLQGLANAIPNQKVLAPLATLLLFVFPTLLLAITLPFGINLLVFSGDVNSNVIGRLYAANTVGSILGVVATAYIFIPFFSTTTILLIVALFLVVLGVGLLFGKN